MSSPQPVRFVVEPGHADRVDRVICARFPGASRKRVAALFADRAVRIDGRLARKGDRAEAGAEVTLTRPPAGDDQLRPAPDPEAAARLTVLYRDSDVVVVNKPAGMPSQPLRAGERGTAAGGLAAIDPACAAASDDPRDGGLVHRLDAGTSGVLIAARSRAAWTALRARFAAGRVTKEYLALVEAAPVAGECHAPLRQRGARVVVDHAAGLDAHTRWTVEAELGARRLLRCTATTGRMHQVRAHLAACGAPIVGDTRYGRPAPPEAAMLVGFFLHAAAVGFTGRSGPLRVEAPLPPDRVAALAALTPPPH